MKGSWLKWKEMMGDPGPDWGLGVFGSWESSARFKSAPSPLSRSPTLDACRFGPAEPGGRAVL